MNTINKLCVVEVSEKTVYYISAFIVAFLLYAVVWFIYNKIKLHRQANDPKTFEFEEEQEIERNAIILKKDIFMIQTGSYKVPSHELEYQVLARFDNGEEKIFFADENSYENLPLNTNAILITQGDDLIDYKL